MTYEIIPTVDGVTGVANYGPSATLFTLGRNHTVYQYDINPSSTPMQVANAQHAPANTPPTPPTMLEERKNPYGASSRAGEQPIQLGYSETESSADESAALSPLQKIAREMDSLDALESEIRDKVTPLSPSSRTSSVSSKSSGRRKERKYLYDPPGSSRASTSTGYDGTEFSFGPPIRHGHESMSSRSITSFTSQSQARHSRRTSNLRKEILRSPQEAEDTAGMDLFPHIKARLREVAFRTPHYGQSARNPELLQREMLSVVFGWNDDVRSLIHDELSRHKVGSASSVLLAKWLGDMGADTMASMIGSESMTSSDWMLLALNSIGAESQKKVGEAFVQRLLEKGDIHPAVAILLGLGENHDAIEVYVSQSYWLEAVLLTCLTCPADWQRISYLIRKWGEAAVTQGQAELAVRCFSCTSIETSEPWFSPRAQDAVYAAQQARLTSPVGMTSPPLSPPSRSGSGRLTAKNASLKLITSFGDKGAPLSEDPGTTKAAGTAMGVTPIAQSALSPGGAQPWRTGREPSTARTATPGGYSRKKRLPSRTDIERAKKDVSDMATPLTAARDRSRGGSRMGRTPIVPEPATAVRPSVKDFARGVEDDDNHLPSPAHGAFTRLRQESNNRNTSRERKPDGLSVQVFETSYGGAVSPGPSTDASRNTDASSRQGAFSPGPPTGGSSRSTKARAVDEYISSVDEARSAARQERAQSRRRTESRKRGESRSGAGRAGSRMREASESRGRDNVRYIKPAKRSPSSPVPMSPMEIAQASTRPQKAEPASAVEPATTDDESFYKITVASPTESHRSGRSNKAKGRKRSIDKARLIGGLAPLNLGEDRGRSAERDIEPPLRSPSLPTLSSKRFGEDEEDGKSDGRRLRFRARSNSRQSGEDLQSRRLAQRDRKPMMNEESIKDGEVFESSTSAKSGGVRARTLTRKEIAAQELEARRRSLARRPSAPAIPLPGDLLFGGRPGMGGRSHTDLGDSPTSLNPHLSRSQTVDPEAMSRTGNYGTKSSGTSTTSTPIGLPATPRAMRHPRYMSSDPAEREGTPPVPEIPGKFSELSGSSLSQVNGSSLSQASLTSSGVEQGSMLSSNQSKSVVSENSDSVGPLLPSTVFGQKGSQALPSRSASAPPEKQNQNVHPLYKSGLPASNRRLSASRGQVRKISPPDVGGEETGPASIDAALHGDQSVIIIPEEDMVVPPMLPELQHLAIPPPPPPPTMYQQSHHQTNSSGVIDIAIDEGAPSSAVEYRSYPMPMERAQTASPTAHRKHPSTGDSFSSRIRGFGDRMRSSSKSRTKSPPLGEYKPAPYETVLPPVSYGHARQSSLNHERAQSPYEQAMAAAQNSNQIPPPPPPPPAPMHGGERKLSETAIPPVTLPNRSQSSTGYRNPKEIRANMPPETLQQGVYQGGFL